MRGPLKRCRRPPFVCQPPMLLGKFLIISLLFSFAPTLCIYFACSSPHRYEVTLTSCRKRGKIKKSAWKIGKYFPSFQSFEQIFRTLVSILASRGSSIDHCHGSGTTNAFCFWPCCALLNTRTARSERERASSLAQRELSTSILFYNTLRYLHRRRIYSYKIANSCYRHNYIGAVIALNCQCSSRSHSSWIFLLHVHTQL
jgi:hypothetical protein